MGDLTVNFSRKEFACKCGCGKDNINLDLVNRLQRLRNHLGIPIVIASGVRCEAYNAKVGGVDSSAHVEGLAVDVVTLDSVTRFKIISDVFMFGLFNRIGIGKTFVHLDIDLSKPIRVIWTYY